MTILDAFADAVAEHGDRAAIIDGKGRQITFDDLHRRARAFAAGFAARGVGHGDRVLVAMPVGIDLYACLAALWRLGAVVVFPEPAMGLDGLRHALRTTRPKAFLSAGWYRLLGLLVPELWRLEPRLVPHAADAHEAPATKVEPDDTALISFTSGSTGAPKAIARTHRFMMAQNDAVAPLLDPDGNAERDLVAFPVFVLVCLALGITSVLPSWKLTRHDRASATRIHRQIARDRVTRLLVPPAICETLSHADTMPQLGAIFTGGGPVFPDTIQRLAALAPGARIVAVYGSTEAEPIAHLAHETVSEADMAAMRTGGGLLAGHPVPAIDVIIEDGEILVAGPHVNEGYLDPSRNAEAKVKRDGRIWHRTGDAGRFDADGRLWLLGRAGAKIGDTMPFAVETAARFWEGASRSALANIDGKPVLAVSGDPAYLADWRASAGELGISDVRLVRAIPLDKRHRSKTDYPALGRLLRSS